MTSGIYKITNKTRQKMSQSHMGKKLTKKHKENISKARIGYRHTKEALVNMSKAQIGRMITKTTRQRISHALIGYEHTKVTCKKMSNAKFRKNGKLNNNWQGGISFEPYTINFNNQLKQQIRKRDNNICQLCSKRKYRRELDIHHIDYNKKNCNEENLIALHRKCNVKVNGRRDYWFVYFKCTIRNKYGYKYNIKKN